MDTKVLATVQSSVMLYGVSKGLGEAADQITAADLLGAQKVHHQTDYCGAHANGVIGRLRQRYTISVLCIPVEMLGHILTSTFNARPAASESFPHNSRSINCLPVCIAIPSNLALRCVSALGFLPTEMHRSGN